MITITTTAMAIMYVDFIFLPLITSDNVDSVVISIPNIIIIEYIDGKTRRNSEKPQTPTANHD